MWDSRSNINNSVVSRSFFELRELTSRRRKTFGSGVRWGMVAIEINSFRGLSLPSKLFFCFQSYVNQPLAFNNLTS